MRSMLGRVRAMANAPRVQAARRALLTCRALLMGGALMACVTLLACGGDLDGADDLYLGAPEEELGSLEQALSAGCGSTGPLQRTFSGRATAFTATTMMQTQGCQGDSYMFAIQSYGSGLGPLQNPKIRPDPLPSNRQDCEATELRFFVWAGTTLRGSGAENGTWQGQGLGCRLSPVAPASLAMGGTYRFAVSGKRIGGPLVPVRVEHPDR